MREPLTLAMMPNSRGLWEAYGVDREVGRNIQGTGVIGARCGLEPETAIAAGGSFICLAPDLNLGFPKTSGQLRMSTVIPQYLIPRGIPMLQRHPRAFFRTWQSLHRSPTCRYASTQNPKPIVLEKPAKFNPPSHPARLNRRPPRNYPGPRLTESQKEEQKTKQYPNSFPPEGTWRYWFLTNRRIHVFITLVCPGEMDSSSRKLIYLTRMALASNTIF